MATLEYASYAVTDTLNDAPELDAAGAVIPSDIASPGFTAKLPVPVSVETTVSVAVMVCVGAIVSITVVTPTPFASVIGPGLTKPGSPLVSVTVPLYPVAA